jgi:hypothetical protein
MPRPSPNQYPRQDSSQSPGFTLVPQGRPLGKPPEAEAEAEPDRPLADFSIVTSAVNSLEDEGRSRAVPPAPAPARTQPARTTRSAEASPAPTTRNSRTTRTRQTPAQANPSRVWVQVATGTNRAGLLYTYGQFRRRAGNLLGNKAAFTAPNRLLVGPFPNEAAAGSFARQLSAHGVPSHSWTSDAGQRIDQLQAAASDDSRTSSRTASTERSGSGSRSTRGSTGSRSERNSGRAERNSSRNERAAANSSGRNRNGTTSGRTGNSRTGTASSRNGRNGAASTRSASSGTGRDRSGAGRSTSRSGKPASAASTRSSRGGSSGLSRSSTRRGR